jgi:hypothetical protein
MIPFRLNHTYELKNYQDLTPVFFHRIHFAHRNPTKGNLLSIGAKLYS